MLYKRIEFIDIAKAIAIFLVVFGHVIPVGTVAKTMVYSFHMPLFFILSGYFMKGGVGSSLKCLLKKKWFALMVPYLIWGGIYSELNIKNLLFIGYGTRETLLMAHSLSSLWFLPVMFFAFCYNFIADKIICKYDVGKNLVSVITIVLFLLIGILLPHIKPFGIIWGADIAFVAAAFLKIGQLVKNNISSVAKLHENVLGASVFVLLLIFSCTFRFSVSSDTVKHVLMANALYGNVFVFLFNALLGSLIVLLLALLLEKLEAKNKLVLAIGRNTLGIFLIHKPIIELMCKGYKLLGVNYDGLYVSFLTSCIVIVVSMILIYIIKRFIPVLLR